MKKAEWLKELRSAMDRGLTVEIDREDITDDQVRGFIVAANDTLVAIHNLSDSVTLDGHIIVRTEDITRFREADADIDAFYRRALEIRGQKPAPAKKVRLDSIEELLSSVHEASELVTVHTEKVDDEICFIGQVVDIKDGDLLLIELDASACWSDEPERYRIKDITRVDFGSSYDEALWLVSEYNRKHGVEAD